MILNAITIELTELIKEHSQGFTILPLTVDPNRDTSTKWTPLGGKYQPLDNDIIRGGDRFICYYAVPGSTSYTSYFLDHAKPNKNTFILIKRRNHHHRIVSLKIADHTKIRITYWRAYGWGHTKDSTCHYYANKPNTNEAKEEGKHIIRLLPIYKAIKAHKKWNPTADFIDLTTLDFIPITKTIIQTIKQSHKTKGLPKSVKEMNMSGIALANTGEVFEVDAYNTPLSKEV